MENELKKGKSGSRKTSSGGYCGPGKIDLDQEVNDGGDDEKRLDSEYTVGEEPLRHGVGTGCEKKEKTQR